MIMESVIKIESFKNDYDFLSNFFMRPIKFEELIFKSVEHGYQAAKAHDNLELEQQILDAKTASETKKLGKKANLPHDWDSIGKLEVMTALVEMKFEQHTDLMDKLIATGDAELVEGNWWGDTYWGVCKGVGQNMLGKILMNIRDKEKINREDRK